MITNLRSNVIDESVVNFIYRIVWDTHRRSGVDWNELYSEAVLTYFVKLDKYDPSKGKKGTWIFTCIKNRLYNFVKEEKASTFISLEENPTIDRPFVQIPFFELYDSLSEDSKFITDIILWDPYEYIYLPNRIARGKVAKILAKKYNWSSKRIWNSFQTLKKELRNVSYA